MAVPHPAISLDTRINNAISFIIAAPGRPFFVTDVHKHTTTNQSLNDMNFFARTNKLFLYSVILPTFLSILYFGLIASPVYISESRFVVYSPSQHFSGAGLSSIIGNLSGNNSTSAAYAVHDYIGSWDAMLALDKAYDLKHLYGNHDIDVFDRFGGLIYPFSSHVDLLRYYNTKVTDSIDTTSGITNLKVKAYTADDAQRLNTFLLQKSQDIVNQMNDTARRKAVFYAQNEVTEAEKNLRTATVALAKYRNMHHVFSPPAQSALQLQMVSKLQDQLITQKGEISALRAHAPRNPQLPVLESNVKALEMEINNQSSAVTGTDQSLASKDVEYERLLVDQTIAQKLLEVSVTSLEQARVTAQKQELYLETISRPNLPDDAQEPRRFKDIVATLLVSLIVYGILTIVIAGVREHHDR